MQEKQEANSLKSNTSYCS
ncbi:hypothetical protein M8C21_031976 [Ambrosia artemisiifolia]|uniref:Uncharacterized protein n=1 Tax=Ambrosia artemisiifolia TaxID=4212 RepID=A0AAD5C379_AMBAR|nr:hypothetical protein M8C21_031976 [Ambrosia artemisiifolia]